MKNQKKTKEKSISWNESNFQDTAQIDNYDLEEKLKPSKNENNWDSKKITVPIEDSENKQKDWDIESAYYSKYLTSDTPPESIYLHLQMEFPDGKGGYKPWKIHKQKEGTFSCIGYATTDMVHWYLNQRGFPTTKLSARFNWMAAKEIDSLTSRPTTFIERAGSTLKAGLDVCRKYGCVDDVLLPTDEDSSFPGTTQQFYSQASKYKIHAYYNLMLPSPTVIFGDVIRGEQKERLQVLIWKKWIAENGPILVRVNVDKIFYNAKDELLEDYQENESFQKHAALLVGYNEEGFILRNSWGTSWGKDGYASLSNKYAFQALDEAYGVVMPSNEVGNPRPPQPHEKSLLEWLLSFI